MFTIDRTKTSFEELNHILDTVGSYPVQGRDIDGTLLWVSWVEPEDAEPFCTLYEPGTEELGTKITSYFSDGSTYVSYSKP